MLSFDADINDYVKIDDVLPYKRMEKDEFNRVKEAMSKDTEKGFLNRLPLLLFFGKKRGMPPMEIVKNALSFLKHDYKVVGWHTHIVDGDRYYDILISSSYKNLTTEIMADGIGDYCISNRGWLGRNLIFGECSCIHGFVKGVAMYGYQYLQRVIGRFLEGGEMEYRNSDKFYYPIDITLKKDEYMDGDRFLPIVDRNGKRFSIKDPRKWTWK
jgi:hypothetical protein